MSEPTDKQPNPFGTGAPEFTEEQYQKWLEEMAPFLRQGSSLWYSMDKAAILTHATSIYEKYRLGDWFSQKVDAYRATVGDMIANVGFKVIEGVHTRMIESQGKATMTSEEVSVWKTMAEKHRAAQQFFVNRTETAPADDSKIGKILDSLETTNYDKLADDLRRQVEGQTVATNPPVQDQGQTGADSTVQPESNPS